MATAILALKKGNAGGAGFKRDQDISQVCDALRQRLQTEAAMIAKYACYEMHGKSVYLAKSSLYIFHEKAPLFGHFRKLCVWLVEWKWFDRIILTAIIVNSILLMLPESYNPEGADPSAVKDAENVALVLSMLFTVELGIKVIAKGLLLGSENCYLRDAWNVLDGFVVLTGLLELAAGSGGNFRVFRTFRILRPLRSINSLPALRCITVSLLSSGTSLLSWVTIAGFVYVLFAILGNTFFGDVYWHRCRLTSEPVIGVNGSIVWMADPNQTQFCGGRYTCQPTWDGSPTFCRSPVDPEYDLLSRGYDPWPEIMNNPHADWAVTGFQSFHNGILTSFQVTTTEGWADLMYRYQDGSDTVLAMIFFVSLMLFGSMIVVNLILAILWEKYDSEAKKRNLHERIERGEHRSEKLPPKILRMKLNNLVTEVHYLETQKANAESFKNLDTNATDASLKNIGLSICTSAIFQRVVTTTIICNTITLALDSHPSLDSTVIEVTDHLNRFFTIVFTFEAIMKIIGLGANYWTDMSNLFDLTLVIISLMEMSSSGGGSPAASLRMARLLRVIRLAKSNIAMRVLLMVIGKATAATCNFCIVVLLLLYIFSLIGVQSFYQSDLDGGAEGTRLNFNSFYWAFITTFAVLVGDRWDLIARNTMVFTGSREGSFLYTITLFLFGKMILLNLFLGIFASAFATARDEVMLDNRYRMYDLITDKTPEEAYEIKDNFRSSKSKTNLLDSPRDSEIMDTSVGLQNMNILLMMKGKKMALKRRHRSSTQLTNGHDMLAADKNPMSFNGVGLHKALPPLEMEQHVDGLRVDADADSEHQHRILRLLDGQRFATPPLDLGQHSHGLRSQHDVEASSGHLRRFFFRDGKHNAPPPAIEIPETPPASNANASTDVPSSHVSFTASSDLGGHQIGAATGTNGGHQKVNFGYIPPDDGTEGAIGLYEDKTRKSVWAMQQAPGLRPAWYYKVPGPPRPLVEVSRKIALRPQFDHFILVLILISSVTLAMDNPYTSDESSLKKIVNNIDVVFTLIFTVEMLLKMIALGLVLPYEDIEQPAYLCVGWNWIDTIVVVSALADMVMSAVADSPGSLRSLRTLRTLRGLRPLRLIKRNKGIKVIVDALLNCLPTMSSMCFIAFLFYFGSAVLFVNLFKGMLYYCSLDPTGRLLPDLETEEDCYKLGGQWLEHNSNFDNVSEGLMSLFHAGSPEGWMEIMFTLVDARGVGMQPRPNAHPARAILMVLFICLANFFLLNLFVGVLIDQYTVTRAEIDGQDTFSPQEKLFTHIQLNFLNPDSLVKRQNKSQRQGCHAMMGRLVESHVFESFILVCIFGNTILMCLRHPTESQNFSDLMSFLNFIFAMIFNVEAALKLFVYRASYFKERWNVFDFVIVVGTDLSLLLNAIGTSGAVGNVAPIVRVFRIARVLRMIRSAQSLKILFTTLFETLPALVNVGGLLFLVLFMFSCLGVSLFGTIADGEELGDAANFRTFGDALLLLIRCSVGERWHKVMHDLVGDRPGCTTEVQSAEDLKLNGPRGCGTVLGYLYFVIYVLFVVMIVMKLFVAAVLDGFGGVALQEQMIEFEKQRLHFLDLWDKYDTEQSFTLHLDDALKCLMETPKPFGMHGDTKKRSRLYLRWLPLTTETCKVHLRDIIVLAVKRSYLWIMGEKERLINLVPLDEELLQKWISFFPEEIEEHLVAHVMIKDRFNECIQERRAKYGGRVTANSQLPEKRPVPPQMMPPFMEESPDLNPQMSDEEDYDWEDDAENGGSPKKKPWKGAGWDNNDISKPMMLSGGIMMTPMLTPMAPMLTPMAARKYGEG